MDDNINTTVIVKYRNIPIRFLSRNVIFFSEKALSKGYCLGFFLRSNTDFKHIFNKSNNNCNLLNYTIKLFMKYNVVH